MSKIFKEIKLHPIMTFTILIIGTILLSFVLNKFEVGSTYNVVDTATKSYEQKMVTVESLLTFEGFKYIFSSTVTNFVAFTPLSMLIIILIGLGVMEKSNFLKTSITLLTQNVKRQTVTFVIALLCILFSLVGDLGYVVMIPISALIFFYGRRNPILGIVTAYASLTCGSGLSLLMTATDSSLISTTLSAATILDPNYTISVLGFMLIMATAIVLLALAITAITEKISLYNVPKYEFKEERKEFKLTRKEVRGLVFALTAGAIYILIILFNVIPIPGIEISGKLIDYSQELYINKLFSPNSFFAQGFIFIVTTLFVILGLFYGIGAKTIKNNHDFSDTLGHSLDGIGETIVLIFMASVFINIFKKSNIGVVVTSMFTNLIVASSFKGIPLLILLFVTVSLETLLIPNSTMKWSIMAGSVVPILMNAGISPEMGQVAFRFAESVTYGLTPVMAYFVIYLAFVEKYNQNDSPIQLFKALKYQKPYALATGAILLGLLIIWFVVGLPLGLHTLPTM